MTSIPREAYLSAEGLPTGATPSGAWLLFAYLRYAEELAEVTQRRLARSGMACDRAATAAA